jgi:16S rRNA (adenine1518-N6/adenine1519-N6)-dimethyltransferase
VAGVNESDTRYPEAMPTKAPRLGQNFLTGPSARQAIVDALGDISRSTVVEIGPGMASITDLLATRAQRLIAIELDRTLIPVLKTRFPAPHVTILEQDVLTVDLTALAAEEGAATLGIVGNLPYYITSDILLHLFAHQAVIGRAVVMVQREVGDRIVAAPGTSDYGMLSATCQLYARAERLLTLPPEAFSPPPKVHSSVIRLTMHPRFEELGVDAAGFIRHLRQSFAQKRKTLANNLRAAGFAQAEISAAFKAAEIDAQSRAESLTLEQQAAMYRALAR